MSPRQAQLLENLEKRVNALERGESIEAIESIKRRALSDTVTSDATSSSSSLDIDVRNAADSGSETVAKQYDKAVRLYLLNGQSILVGGYN